MFLLKYDNIIDFSKRSHTLVHYTSAFACFAVVGQLIMFFYRFNIGVTSRTVGGFLLSFMLPALCYGAVVLLMTVVTNRFDSAKTSAALAYINLFLVCLLCLFIIFFYSADHSAICLFALPIVASLLYVDKKPLNFTFAVSIVACILHGVFSFSEIPGDLIHREFVEFVTSLILLLCVYFLAHVILKSMSSIVHAVIKRDDQIKRDSFLGLFNHTAFYDHLDECITENHKSGLLFSLIIWDIDNFKSINDTFGHDMGDRVLRLFTKALNECIGIDDTAFRYGGEEFTVLAHINAEEAYELSEHVRLRFTQHSVTLPIGDIVTASAGICEYKRAFGGSREFFSAADRALYVAKRTEGKNKSIIWSDSMYEEATI